MRSFMTKVVPPLAGVALFFLCVSTVAGLFLWSQVRENRKALATGRDETWYGQWSKATPNHKYYGPVIGVVFLASLAGLVVPPIYKHYHPSPTFEVAVNTELHLTNIYPPDDALNVPLGTLVTLVCQYDSGGAGVGHYGALLGNDFFNVGSTQLELVPSARLATCNDVSFGGQPHTDKNTKYYGQQ
jgi:hypothetical protein